MYNNYGGLGAQSIGDRRADRRVDQGVDRSQVGYAYM